MAAVACLSGVRLTNTANWLIAKVISGGQTGADRAALDWACENGMPHGGWCPKGRIAADGPLAPHYQLCETDSAGYRQRTKLNVRDSDATLVCCTRRSIGPMRALCICANSSPAAACLTTCVRWLPTATFPVGQP